MGGRRLVVSRPQGGLALLELQLGPDGAMALFQLGGVASLASDRSLATEATDRDQVKLRFTSADQLHDGRLAAFLKAHLEALQTTTVG